jgi:hypothetical protein
MSIDRGAIVCHKTEMASRSVKKTGDNARCSAKSKSILPDLSGLGVEAIYADDQSIDPKRASTQEKEEQGSGASVYV